MNSVGSFGQSQATTSTTSGGVEWYTPSGRALTTEERLSIAKRRGICVNCGVRTHAKFLRKAITDDHAYQGICIRCNPDNVPSAVAEAWRVRNLPNRPVITAAVRPVLQSSSSTGGRPLVAASGSGGASTGLPLQTSIGTSAAAGAVGVVDLDSGPDLSSTTNDASDLRSSTTSAPPTARVGPPTLRASRAGGNTSPFPSRNVLSSSSSAIPPPAPPGSAPAPLGRKTRHDLLDGGSSSHRDMRAYSPAAPGRKLPGNRSSARPGLGAFLAGEHPGIDRSDSATVVQTYENDTDLDYIQNLTKPEDFSTTLRDKQGKREIVCLILQRARETEFPDGAPALVDVLAEFLESFRSDTMTVKFVCGAIWKISADSQQGKRDLLEGGACRLLVDAVKEGKADEHTRNKWVLGALNSLAIYTPTKTAIAQAGGIEVVMESMEKFEQSAQVVLWACRCLHTLVSDDEGLEGERNAAAMEEGGGVARVVKALQPHASETLTQLWGIQLLWSLMNRSDEGSVNRVKHQMVDGDFIALGMRILRARSTESVLFSHTAALMARVLHGSAKAGEAADCVPSIVRMMNAREDDGDEAVQESGCLFLIALCSGESDDARNALLEGDAAKVIMNTIEKLPQNCGLIEAGIWGVCRLASDPSRLDASVVEKIFRTISDLCRKNPDSLDFLQLACGFLATASEVHRDATLIVTMDALPLALASSNDDAVETAVDALLRIGRKFPEDAENVMKWVGADLLTRLCLNSRVQIKMLDICGFLTSQSNIVRRSLVSAGILDAGTKLLEKRLPAKQRILVLEFIALMAATAETFRVPAELERQLIESIKNSTMEEFITRKSCIALRNITIATAGQSEVSNRAGWIVPLLSKASLRAETVVEICRFIIVFATKSPKECHNVGEAIFRSLLEVMHRYSEEDFQYHAQVHKTAARATSVITKLIRKSVVALDNDDIDAVVASVYKVIENDDNEVEALADLLQVLTHFCTMNEETMLYAGIIVVLIDIMAERGADSLIQERGCRVLARLSASEDLQVNLSIVQTEGVDMIVNGMRQFPENTSLQSEGCKAFSHLGLDEESRVLILAHGGLQLSADGMKQMQQSELFMLNALKAIRTLTMSNADTLEGLIMETSLIDMLVAALRNFPFSADLLECCLGAIANTAKCSKSIRSQLARANVCKAIEGTMKGHISKPPVIKAAMGALAAVFAHPSERDVSNYFGGPVVEAAVLATLATVESEDVQRHACQCMYSLGNINQTAVLAAGGKEAIGYSIQAHYTSANLLVEAFKAFSKITTFSPNIRPAVAATEPEVQGITWAMKRFKASETIQTNGCFIFKNLLYWRDNARVIKLAGNDLRDALDKAANKFPGSCQMPVREIFRAVGW